MLEWNGERFLPWIHDAAVAYEHMHRYAQAAGLSRGKRVLDLASGEGYGSNILAQAASCVVGVEIDPEVVKHASSRYPRPNLKFLAGSITAVPIDEDHSFDLIVCFEAIEHISDHDRLLSEAARLLRPEGLFMVSTPNKSIYNQETHEENPFHVKELEMEEFRQILARYFRNVKFFGQRILAHSNIWPIDSPAGDRLRKHLIERQDNEFKLTHSDTRTPLYVIALASNSAAAIPETESVLVDSSNQLLTDLDDALKWREQQMSDRDQTIKGLESAISWKDGQIRELSQGVEWMRNSVREMERTISADQDALDWRAQQVDDLDKAKTALQTNLDNTYRRFIEAAQQLDAIHASRGWKLLVRLRHIRDKIKGLVKSPVR